MDNHLYIPDDPQLADLVACFWEMDRRNDTFRRETIIPNGLLEIIFHFCPDQPIRSRLYNRSFTIPRCFIQAYHQGPIELDLPARQFMFGIVLHPAALKTVFGLPAGELAANCVDMELVNPSFERLWQRMAEQPVFAERVSIVSDWLKKRMPTVSLRERAFNQLLFNRTVTSVPELSERLCYSPRQLSRKFREFTGMNTEQGLLYMKHLKSIDLIHRSKLSLTAIAYECRFADQSHFIKTFRSFATLAPSEYRSRKSFLPGHILEDVR
jgi:AraC-like DNA-binding protein